MVGKNCCTYRFIDFPCKNIFEMSFNNRKGK